MALGALHAIGDLGLEPSKGVSIAGLDNITNWN